MKKILIATKNQHKLEEFKEILGRKYEILSLFDFPEIPEIEETGTTFEANALLKARTLFKATGQMTISDDSGLVVEALNGAPGIYSARYAGSKSNDADNRKLLLKNMDGVTHRNAYFECSIALIDSDSEHIFNGRLHGEIGSVEKGQNGFGYDPLFIPTNDTRSLAEYESSEKNKISHRALASQKLIDHLLAEISI